VTKELVDEVYDTVQSIPKTLRLIGLSRSAQQNNVSSSLHKIHHPTLLIWGLQDEITPPETALHFHDLLPNSELKFIDKCGHVPMMEQPLLFNQYMEEFLTTNA
ncbi:MAG TPA: alpha/beta hydrolase, partial [Cyclobacteriaceae bacterium]